MASARFLAPAKINLSLHITGRRIDGYHLLDSLVAFGDIGDVISVAPAQSDTQARLIVSGSFAENLPPNSENIIFQAARLIAPNHGLAFSLVKNLPVAAGLGGGSSDAAATLRALSQELGRDLPGKEAVLGLGADVPACLEGRPLRMRGIGEDITLLENLPEMGVLLVNPGVPVPSGAIFSRLKAHQNPPMMRKLPAFETPEMFVSWLAEQRNDLEAPAISYAPVISEVLGTLRSTKGCLLARMSGSGASCFGLYRDRPTAEKTAHILARKAPNWWVKPCQFMRATT